jgi:hypothetical protein
MKENNMISKLGFFFVILPILFFPSCENDNRDVVPFVKVDIVLDLQIDLSGLGNLEVATITPNSLGLGRLTFSSPHIKPIDLGQAVYGNGIILYREDTYVFHAYDITCTYRADIDYCALEMGDNWYYPTCPCCESVFNLLLEGAPPIKEPAALPLQQYNTFIRNNQLYIKN